MAEDQPSQPLLDIQVAPGTEVVLTLRGDLDPHTAPLLDAALRDAVESADLTRVVIDLAGISFIDSSGLRVFVAQRAAIAERGAELALRNPTANTRRLLDVTGLGEIIAVE